MAATTTPISTYKTYFMYKTTSAATQYTKLCDIKSFPDLGSAPERVDVTTLSDRVRKYVQGVQDLSSFDFGANYIPSVYQTIAGLNGTQHEYAIWLGASTDISTGIDTPTGEDGKWSWTGDISVFKAGGDVNAAQDMTITAFPSTGFAFTYGS